MNTKAPMSPSLGDEPYWQRAASAVDFTQAEGFHHADVPMYNVISRNRVQMLTHNLELARAYASKLAAAGNVTVVESTTFELIGEFTP